MPFPVPESVHAYVTDSVARTAVDTLLESETHPKDEDLGWDKLADFQRAVLAAHQVRCEYAVFLIELWDEVWKPCFESGFGASLERRTITDTEEWCEQPFTPSGIWDQGWFGVSFAGPSRQRTLCVGVCLDDARSGVQLSAQLHDARDRELLDQGALGEPWEEEDEVMWTTAKTVPINERRDLDLETLRDAARAALAAVERHPQG